MLEGPSVPGRHGKKFCNVIAPRASEVTRLRKVAIEASQRAALQAQPPPRGVELGDFVA